ncbi:hypothetical protein LIER_25243 [Lithospermum erythrorhizon]|uniref:Reverse transcriptase RNase H-like domain-containing protein n=1 Tax=Lithospermum erythrorhizon TaxID=34254 RepID=A0AAV3R8B5_LITER
MISSKEEFIWDSQCNAIFEELKLYLGSNKLLTRPEEGEELQLYLAVSEGTVSSVLLQEERGVQKPIYFVSHVLHGSKENYPLIDKFVLAFVTSARKLKAYVEAHPIKVMTDQPIKQVVSSPAQYGRLTTWTVELSEFEINYAPRIGIKAQVLANYIVEKSTRTVDEVPSRERMLEEAPKWTLVRGDGSRITDDQSLRHQPLEGLRGFKAGHRAGRDQKVPRLEEIAIMRVMEEEEDWRSPIARLILTSELPSDGVEERKIKSRSYKFQMIQGELYKRSHLGPLLCSEKEHRPGPL